MLDSDVKYFIGMHFPASDIPKQAQQLYIINRIRLLHDQGAEPARLVSIFFIFVSFLQVAIESSLHRIIVG
jgi:hypothetical protein